MKDVTSAKGLSDLRTASTHHVAAKPARKGTAYLDLYALSMERQRLETELSRLEKRGNRIRERLGEIEGAMGHIRQTAEEEDVSRGVAVDPGAGKPARSLEKGGQQWKRMPVEY